MRKSVDIGYYISMVNSGTSEAVVLYVSNFK